jgi:anti-sigma B factor antagonist
MNEGLLKATVTTGEAVVLKLVGDLHAPTVSMMSDLLDAAMTVGRPTVTVDMSEISFIDLNGLDVLLESLDQARQNQVQLVLRSPSNRVLDMLLLSGCDNLFTLDLTDHNAAALSLIAPPDSDADNDPLTPR